MKIGGLIRQMSFGVFAIVVQVVLIILFVIFMRYNPNADGGKDVKSSDIEKQLANTDVNQYYAGKIFLFFC